MALCGLADRVADLNREAVALARRGLEAAGRPDVLLAGSIGPTGEMIEPYGDLSQEDARAAFSQQAAALVEAGIDLVVCETFADLDELALAVSAVCELTDRPVFASMAYETSGRTMMGVTPAAAAARLATCGVAGIGANCSTGPDDLARVVEALHAAAGGLLLLAKPNAGLPQLLGGRTVYTTGPEALAGFAERMVGLGVSVIGGCCGTTPDHIAAMRAVLDRRTAGGTP
jgi:methionine synthase I (cobalamin-dependent)